jgi:hypothetical protein
MSSLLKKSATQTFRRKKKKSWKPKMWQHKLKKKKKTKEAGLEIRIEIS